MPPASNLQRSSATESSGGGAYARLAVVAATVTAATLAAIWVPLKPLIRSAGTTGDGGRAGVLLATGLVLTAVVLIICWLATLRGAWLLGESGRRSAVVAWLRGLGATLRQPIRSLWTLALWAVPGFALLVLPLLVEGPRHGWCCCRPGSAAPSAGLRSTCRSRRGCLGATFVTKRARNHPETILITPKKPPTSKPPTSAPGHGVSLPASEGRQIAVAAATNLSPLPTVNAVAKDSGSTRKPLTPQATNLSLLRVNQGFSFRLTGRVGSPYWSLITVWTVTLSGQAVKSVT